MKHLTRGTVFTALIFTILTIGQAIWSAHISPLFFIAYLAVTLGIVLAFLYKVYEG